MDKRRNKRHIRGLSCSDVSAHQCTYITQVGQWVKVDRDGNCLYRAVSESLYGNPDQHSLLRRESTQYIDANRSQFEYAFDSGPAEIHAAKGTPVYYSDDTTVMWDKDNNTLTVIDAHGHRHSNTTVQSDGCTHILNKDLTSILIQRDGKQVRVTDANGITTTAVVELSAEGTIRMSIEHEGLSTTRTWSYSDDNKVLDQPENPFGFTTLFISADQRTVTYVNQDLTVSTTMQETGNVHQEVTFPDGSAHTIVRDVGGEVTMTHTRPRETIVVQRDAHPSISQTPDKESTGTLEEYLREQRKNGTFATEISIVALCCARGLDMTIVLPDFNQRIKCGSTKVWVLYLNGNHYDAIVPKDTVFSPVPHCSKPVVTGSLLCKRKAIEPIPSDALVASPAKKRAVTSAKRKVTESSEVVLCYHKTQDKVLAHYIQARRQRMHGQILRDVLHRFTYTDAKGQEKSYTKSDWDYDKRFFTFVLQTPGI